jgi:exosortase
MQAWVLWSIPHYQFFPLLPVAAALLAYRGVRDLGRLQPGITWLTLGLLGVACLLNLAAAVIYSPAIGTVAAFVSLVALAHGIGGARLLEALVPSAILLALLIRPPLRIDLEIIYALQTVATNWSSRMLDLLGTAHVASGHVMEIQGHRLFVEEACSGITSLYVVLAVVLCVLLWTRRSLYISIVLLAAAAAWTFVANVARITLVTAAMAGQGIDLTKGLAHEALGVMGIVIVLGLIASTDRLIVRVVELARVLYQPVRERLAARRQQRQFWRLIASGLAPEEFRATVSEDQVPPATPAATPPAILPVGEPTYWPEPQSCAVASTRVLSILAALAVVNVAASWSGIGLSPRALEAQLRTLKAESLPEDLGGFRRVAFDSTASGPANAGAAHARRWLYKPGVMLGPAVPTMTVEVDSPYVGWHELTDCYKAAGWVIKSRSKAPVKGAAAVVARMDRPLEGTSLLVFGFDDSRGRPVSPPDGPGWRAVLRERVSQGAWRLRGALGGLARGSSGRPVTSYQVQLLVQTSKAPTAEDEAQALALFERVRNDVRRNVRATGG